MMAGPLLLTALLIGLLVSLFQPRPNQRNDAVVHPQDSRVFTLIISGSWLIQLLSNFTIELLTNIPQMVN
ncbi:EscS/YscS/HrcS family type III secretion system export apparatus protein [Salinicola tamaricis]|uniref:EscS/YscS/HrcS family type III secretion system export apparatus protein n=1 Tax=Salinicola tamaricis TaxID=1771309 RepID=UPI003BF5FC88